MQELAALTADGSASAAEYPALTEEGKKLIRKRHFLNALLSAPMPALPSAAAPSLLYCGTEIAALKWWQKAIVYEIYVNSFQDSDGDGYGDLNGIRSRLDYLRGLGVGALWLTPVYASPMVDNGYDVSDYRRINPLYGTMDDMDALIAEAENRGIRIVMDLVFNHTSDQCAWFKKSEKDRDGRYGDWYIWRDAKPDGSAPNNWRSIFGGSAWTWSESRQQYYLHTFAAAQPDLNWENPEVREALFDVARFWLDKGVGGFRMDAVPYIKKPADFSDGPADGIDGMADIHYMTANTEGILDYLKEFKKRVVHGRDIFTVGEVNGVKPGGLKAWVGTDGVFDMLFEFSHVNLDFDGAEVWHQAVPWTVNDLKKALSASQAATAETGWYPVYFENHDKARSINHFFGDAADPAAAGKALAAVLLTLRGTPFLYQGEELGMTNVKWSSIDDYNDLHSHSQYNIALENGFSEEAALALVHRFSRDNARTPMQWSASDNAGFTSGTPWLRVNENYTAVNAQSEDMDPDSVLAWYRELISLRSEHPSLTDGSYSEVLYGDEHIYAFIRENRYEKLLVAVNFSGTEVTYDPAGAGMSQAAEQEIILSSYSGGTGWQSPIPGLLRPYEAVVIKLR